VLREAPQAEPAVPGVTVAMGHEGHGPNEFSSLCRACRIGSDLERIRQIGEGDAMRAPSSEQEGKEIVAEMGRMPRASEVSDRIQQHLDALPYPLPAGPLEFRKAQLEGFQLAMAYTLRTGRDISAEEHAEWMKKLA
jgi:hypothetical protein